ncbi:MAG: S41 family peptidase [Leadbetterella sp.]
MLSKKVLLFFLVISIGLSSCGEDQIVADPNAGKTSPYLNENNWIYSQMKKYYLWEDKMPVESKTDKFLEPSAYFSSLIDKNKDWFSYMRTNKDDVLNFWTGAPYGYGIRFRPYRPDPSSKAIYLAVSLVCQLSPADKGGLYRGDIIQKIDGADITEDNLQTLLNKNTLEFTWKTTENEIKRSKISKGSYAIRPIYNSQVLEIGKKKVVYLAFTQFLQNIDEDLRKVFAEYKAQKVDEFVLDLRFNPGGFTPNAEVFGSLLVKNLDPTQIMFGGNTNKAQTLESQSKPDGGQKGRYWTKETANLNTLDRIYILTSKSTSSSSELIINCLKPHMQVILIGENTNGKNVISTIITDETGKYPFALMPAYSTLENVKGESPYGRKDGFAPDYLMEDNILPYYPIGNLNEPLLKKALDLIAGKAPDTKPISSPFFKVTYTDKLHHYDSHSPFVGN